MKKLLAAFAAFTLLLAACIVPVTALTDYSDGTDIVYIIEDYDVNVTPPDLWMAFTRDDINEDNLKVLGTTKEKLLKHFEENDIYFETAYPDKGEIVLSIKENDDTREIYDLASQTKSVVKLMATAMVRGEAADQIDGSTYTGYDLHSFDDVQYIVLEFKSSKKEPKYGTVYYTVVDGAAYRFTLTSYKGAVSDELGNTLKHLVEQTSYMDSYSDDNTVYYDDEEHIPDGYNNWEDYFSDHPEAYDKTVETFGGVAAAAVVAVIAGILIFTAVIVVVIVLLVKNNNKNKAAMQDYEVRTGPDGRQYFYPKNPGPISPSGGYRPPPAPPAPPNVQQQESSGSISVREDATDDSNDQ